jgi:uncharacterized membrane protein YhaH (DUF805 family)
MNFTTSVKTVFSKYATFKGRARRSEYWFWQLFIALVSIATGLLSMLDGVDADGLPKSGLFSGLAGLVSLALFLPSLAVLVRRLHDTGRSAWNIVYWLVIPAIVALPLAFFGFANLLLGALDGSGQSQENIALGLMLMGGAVLISLATSAVIFVFTLLDSKEDNKYGSSPKTGN